MKANLLGWFLFLLLASPTLRSPAQQTDADRKLLADIRTKAEQGDAQSQLALGITFYLGSLGAAKDEVEAIRWWRKAADQNEPTAQYFLGDSYRVGQGVVKDEVEAVKWFRKAAAQNIAAAQYGMGQFYYSGVGVAKDQTEAAKWYRKAAEQGLAQAQGNLGVCFSRGDGVAKDETEAVRWLRKAADQGEAFAQENLGLCYADGKGVAKDQTEAAKWYRKAAEQGLTRAQTLLANCFRLGQGVVQDYSEAAKWLRKAAEQNYADAQYNLGVCYFVGNGVVKDYVEAYKWWLLAAAQGDEGAKKEATTLEGRMSQQQIAEGQQLARDFKPREVPSAGEVISSQGIVKSRPESSGTGFFITDDGYLVTNEHVVKDATQVRLVTEAGLISARVVKVDAANDLALLKTEGKFAALAVVSSRAVKMGNTVATVGFPNIGLQGFAPKLAKGDIAALSGAQDDPRYFQISVPVQPGNSGGALVDEHGSVVGVVAAKLNAVAAAATSGAIPENVNYAVKSSFLLSFLEAVPEVSAKLKEPSTKECKFEDVVKNAEQAAVLVLVY